MVTMTSPCLFVYLHDFDSCLTLCYKLCDTGANTSSAGSQGLEILVMEKMCNCLNNQF